MASDEVPIRILQIEDNPGEASLLATAIKEAAPAIVVEVTVNGIRAIEHLHQAAQASVLPDLILLDLNMPVMDGFTLLRVISKQEEWRVPVIVLTSSTSPSDRKQARALGATAFLVKPNDFDGYLGLARRLSRFPNLDPTPATGSRTVDA